MNKESLLGAFLAVILISGLFLVNTINFGTVYASTDVSGIPKPSVPEFAVQLIDSSYDVPASSSIGPYTGKTVVHESYRVESRTIEFRIKNQPFVPYWIQGNPEAANWTINFYYNIRYKGHFSEHWTNMFISSDGYPRQDYESDYTVLSYQGEYSSTDGLEFNAGSIRTNFPPDAQVDFQTQAMIGYVSRVYNPNATEPLLMYPWQFTGETSDWSNTQTVTIGEIQMPTPSPATTPTPTPNQKPQHPEPFEMIIGGAIIVIGFAAGLGLLVYVIKRR